MIVSHNVTVRYQLAPIKKRLTLPSQRSIMAVTRSVSEAFGVPIDDMRYSDSRYQYICRARFAAWHIIRRQNRFSLKQIGQAFNFRDHTTILRGIERAAALLERDPDFAARYEEARSQ